MAFQQTLSARVIVDLLSGSSAANVGAIGGSNQLLQQWNPFTLADTGPYTLPLPDDQQALGAFTSRTRVRHRVSAWDGPRTGSPLRQS